jgi:hypothetical protein
MIIGYVQFFSALCARFLDMLQKNCPAISNGCRAEQTSLRDMDSNSEPYSVLAA